MTIKVKPALILALLFCNLSLLNAQRCVDYSDLLGSEPFVMIDTANGYAAGDLIFEADGVKTTFQTLGGNDIGSGFVKFWPESINPEAASLQFDFNLPGEQVNSFSFVHLYGGGTFDISINGSLVTQFIGDIGFPVFGNNNLPANFIVESTPIISGNDFQLITITGDFIESLRIGGNNTVMKAPCYEAVPISTTSCFNWWSINQGAGATYGVSTGYAPGDTLPEIDPKVPITLENHQSRNGAVAFQDFNIADLALYPAWFNQIALHFNFRPVGTNVTQISFDLHGGCCVVTALNDGAPVFADFGDTLKELQYPGYDVEVNYTTTPNNQITYSVTISGNNIESFLLGGFDMPMSDFCYTTNSSSTCEIGDLTIEQVPCLNNSNLLFFDIDFDYANTSDSFTLVGNGNTYGTFLYSELPVRISVIPPTGVTVLEFEASDLGNVDCQNYGEIEFQECPPQGCTISNVVAEASDCNADNQFMVQLNFEYSNPGILGFMVVGDGNFYGIFDYDDLPLTLGPFEENGQPLEFNVFDVSSPSCIGFIEMDPVECPNCEILDFGIWPTDCDSNGYFYVELGLEYLNTSDSFKVLGNGMNYGTFSYDDTNVRVGPFFGDGTTIYELGVMDLENPDCVRWEEFRAKDCNVNECRIRDLAAYFEVCITNSSYILIIDFEVDNPTNERFTAYDRDGDIIGTYLINQLPVVVTVFTENTSPVDFIKVCIKENPDCCATVEFDVPDCTGTNCSIRDVVVEAQPCTPNGVFFIDMDFIYDATYNSDSFKITGNGNNYGTFAYNQLPLLNLGPLNGDGQTNYEFLITDNEFSNCRAYTTLGYVDCDTTNTCEITNLELIVLECTSDTTYNLKVDFDVANATNDFFDIYDDYSLLLGTYPIADLPLVIPNIVINNGEYTEIKVCVNDNPNCCVIQTIETPDCDSTECQILDFGIWPTECDSNGYFYVDLGLEYVNTSDSFKVLGNGQNYGTFSYDNTNVRVGPFFGDGQTIYELGVMDLENADCIRWEEFRAKDCNTTECRILYVIAEPLPCDVNDSFYVEINLEYVGTSTSFKILGNGNNYGTFNYSDLPITLGPFSGNGQSVYEFVAIDLEFPNCENYAEVDALNCTGNECEIYDLEILTLECTSDTTYKIKINFEVANATDDHFDLYNAAGGLIGYYPIADLPITIPNFVGSGNSWDLIQICVNDNPNCCIYGEFEAPNCDSTECQILDFGIWPTECDSNGYFYVDLGLEYLNTSDSFKVLGNGLNYGTFSYDDTNVRVGPFFGNGQTIYELGVMDLENADCIRWEEFRAKDCDTLTECRILQVIAEPLPCEANDSFYVQIDLEYVGTSTSFQLSGNWNINYGTFNYSDLPITLGPFSGDGQTAYEFKATDLEFQTCNNYVWIGPIDCIGVSCSITDLELTPLECTSDTTYNLKINFEVANATNDFFDVYNAGGGLIGTYSLANLPVVVPNFVGSGNPYDVVKVCINDNPNCCAIGEFEAPDCDTIDCRILQVFVEPLPCEANDSFYVVLNLEYVNTSTSFRLLGNGNNYGIFNYSDLPISLGPFSGDGQTAYEFDVIDLEYQTCHNNAWIGPITCTDCYIYALEFTPLECTSDTTYNLKIDFEVDNPTNDFFDVYNAGGGIIGTYSLANLPVVVPNFVASGNTFDCVKICVNDNPGCCTTGEFLALNCDSTICEINDLIVTPVDCTSDTTYEITIDFNVENPGNDFFEVFYANGVLIGTYPLTDLPLTIDNFISGGGTYDRLKVCINDVPNCCDYAEFEVPTCIDTCSISNLDVYPIDCNNDGTYSLAINFDHIGGQTFDLFSGATNLGTYSYNQLPLFIQSFQGSGNNFDEITVCDSSSPNCCLTAEFEALNCNGCEIFELSATAGECDANGEYFVELNFDYQNIGNIGFQVLGNGQDYGNFEYADLPVQIGPFDSNAPDVLEFIVFDIINFNCTAETSLDAQDCEQTCIDFDELSEATYSGNDYNAGDTILTTGGVPVSIQPFTYANGTTDLLNIKIETPFNGASQAMWISNATAVFDFRGLPSPINRISIDISDLGGDENLSVNGGPIHFVNNFTFLPSEVAPGVFYSYTVNNSISDVLVLEGPIETLRIGGQEFYIDNLCYDYAPIEETECVQFESLPCCLMITPNIFDIGDIISVENDVIISYRGGVTLITDAASATSCSDFSAAQGKRLVVSGELGFDFTEISSLPHRIEFDFVSCGNGSELSVNSAPFTNLILDDTTYQISQGVTISVALNPNNPTEGIATLEGEIERFLLIGHELGIDNLCFDVLSDSDNVWPGDTNNDNKSNNLDLLNVGLGFGATGPARSAIEINWLGLLSADWTQFFADQETNFRHADANGDGKIDANDRNAILNNYGSTHGPTARFIEVPGTPNDPSLRVSLEQAAPLKEGEPFNAPILLGDIDHQLDGVYGLAFTIRFNPAMIDPASVRLEVPTETWLGESGSDLIHLNKNLAADGIIEVAITRTDQLERNGFGPIAGFIGIIDNIGGKADLEMSIENVRAINSDETIIPLYTPISKLQISTGTDKQPLEASLKVYPNPAKTMLHILNISEEQVQQIIVHNIIGQQMVRLDSPSSFETINVNTWSSGVYLVEIRTDDKVLTRKVEVIHQ